MRQLYPEIEPYHHFFLPVSDLHTLYVEEVGNPDGKPVLFIHGGPGAGLQPDYRRYFNPDKYRVILVDQRGCGQSTPFAELKENNTANLVADFEKIRAHLDIEQWQIFGGSWGSTLGLVYAETHPQRVTELVLRGIFLGTKKADHWLFGGGGAADIFPDFWHHFIADLDEKERQNPIAAYYQRLTSDDRDTRLQAAQRWSEWEISILQLIHDATLVADISTSDKGVSLATLECHYCHHGCFLEDNQLINNADKIKDIPGVIIHGRYDIVCSAKNAWQLHQAWPKAKLVYVPDAGHSGAEPGIIDQLVRATDYFG